MSMPILARIMSFVLIGFGVVFAAFTASLGLNTSLFSIASMVFCLTGLVTSLLASATLANARRLQRIEERLEAMAGNGPQPGHGEDGVNA